MKRKQSQTYKNKKPFIPSGKINKTFSNLNYKENRVRSKRNSKNYTKMRSRSRKQTQKQRKIRASIPISSIKHNETTYDNSTDNESCFNDEYINNLLNSTQNTENGNSMFDGLDIDDINIASRHEP